MSGRVAIVTDSTASIPAELAAQLGIIVVPLTVRMGEAGFDEDTLDPAAVLDALQRKAQVTTAPPEPPAFFWAYQDAMAAGAEVIVSIHISERLSQTAEAARLAAEQIPIPVHVVDGRSVAMATGYVVVAAAEAIRAGADLRDVAAIIERRRAVSTPLFYVDTLEYLRRGGRIGKASALLGTALEIKPLLTVEDGQIAPLTRVRKSDRAISRLEELALEYAAGEPVDVAIHHVGAPEAAQALARRLHGRFPSVGRWCVHPVSWVLGVHCGPGMLGVVVSKR